MEEFPLKALGWAATDTSGVLSPFHFSRRYLIHICICIETKSICIDSDILTQTACEMYRDTRLHVRSIFSMK